MKTSFYFVLWILIYPLLGLLNNEFIDNYSFWVSFAVVIGVTWWLKRMFPKTLEYEQVSQLAPIMEDIYTGNVAAIHKRLLHESVVETIFALYLLVTTVTIGYSALRYGISDWFALVLFAYFAYGAITRSVKLNNALRQIRENPSVEQCAETASEIYSLDYSSYREARQNVNYEDMLPPRPAHFKVFQIFSIVIAGICALLGIILIALALWNWIGSFQIFHISLLMMYLLYSSLAIYFGVKDFASILQSMRSRPQRLLRTPEP